MVGGVATRVAIRDVSKAYGATGVLEGVSLDVEEGEFVSLVGPSGCGKSTLLRIIAGLASQDSGHVVIGGETVDGLEPFERDVAMVFQSYALYPHMTVRENISLPLVMARLGAMQRLPFIGRHLGDAAAKLKRIGEEVEAVAESIGIGHLLDRKPGQLSGGQRQRVALGRALVRKPKVFLLDEPLSNLDAQLRVHMRRELVVLQRRLGVTTIYVTHDQVEAMTMSDRVALMADGHLLQFGSPDELYRRPASLRVAEFIGSPRINTLPPGTVPQAAAHAPAGTATVAFRPEHAILLEAGKGTAGIPATVSAIENIGSDLFVHLRAVADGAALIVRADPDGVRRLAPGESAVVEVRPDRMLFFDEKGQRIEAGVPHAPASAASAAPSSIG